MNYIVIPARYGSTRLPGKALLDATGRPLIQHVWEKAMGADNVDRVLVATDDERIVAAVKEFGGEVCLTPACWSGTHRVAWTAKNILRLDSDSQDTVINLQGDEPEIRLEDLNYLVAHASAEQPDIVTLAAWVGDEFHRGAVYVVTDAYDRAMYFSRHCIPYCASKLSHCGRPAASKRHIGVYAFQICSLYRCCETIPAADSPATHESLEQLHWLHQGEVVTVKMLDGSRPHYPGIDTADDYGEFVSRWKGRVGLS